jgi:chromosome partition protein MukB
MRMKNKSRIQRVILMNWRGMFFQPFELDEGMTILEGANGTGKTTIMIAAYVCLMPDLNYLNFQNVTTVTARKDEDKGLYGRLGKGDPVFSLLDVTTADNQRHLLGVQLIKKTYPQVTLKHFAIANLQSDAPVEEILLEKLADSNQQKIPDLDEIGSKSREFGGELIHFRHAKEYFKFMFDAGITPIRLMEIDERKQYNQLLHTSLYGGLSRSLQSSLRDYLLPEDNTLVSSIRDMEENLQACRRTRSMIQRYQTAQDTIQNIYQTAWEMFSSAFNASRRNAELSITKALDYRKEYRQYHASWEQMSSDLAAIKSEMGDLDEAYLKATDELDGARELLDKCQFAHNLSREIEVKRIEQQKQEEREKGVRQRYDDLRSTSDQARDEYETLTEQQIVLANQLSDASQAWETISKQAGLYTQADNLLNEAKNLLGRKRLDIKNIDDLLEKSREELQACQIKRTKAYQELNEAELKQSHFDKYLQILTELTGEEISVEKAGSRAKEKIDKFYIMENRLKRFKDLPEELEKVKSTLERQNSIRKQLKDADLEDVDSSEKLDTAWQELMRDSQELEEKQNEIQHTLNEKSQTKQSIQLKLPDIEKQLAQWETFQEWKGQLEEQSAQVVQHPRELSKLSKSTADQLQKLHQEGYQLEAKLQERQALFNTLMETDTNDQRISNLAEQGYGKLLLDRFADIPTEWSANLEGRLGPLTNALVVKDVQSAASDLVQSMDRPDEVWLVGEEDQEKMPEAREMSDSILVRHGDAWRLTRLPEFPILGKKAKDQRIGELRKEIRKISQSVEKNFQNIRATEKTQSLINRLMPLESLLSSKSPLDDLHGRQAEIKQLEVEILKLQEQSKLNARKLENLAQKKGAVQGCLTDKEILDQADLETLKKSLQNDLQNSQELEQVYQQKKEGISQLQLGLDILEKPGVSDLEKLSAAEQEVRTSAEKQQQVVDTLQRLADARENFDFADQVPLLTEKQGLTRHLKDELDIVKEKQTVLKQKLQDYSQKRSEAEQALHEEEKRFLTLDGQLSQLQQNLSELPVEGDTETLANAKKAAEKAKKNKSDREQKLNEQRQKRFRLEAEIDIALENKNKNSIRWQKQFAQARPSMANWRVFRKQAKADGRLERLLSGYYEEIGSKPRRPDYFWRQESAARASLIKILERTPGTQALLQQIKSQPQESDEEFEQGDACIIFWKLVREYLNQVIPVDLQTSDPEKAQESISAKLTTLQGNLEEQERGLRQHVETIPSHINAKTRNEKSRIRKLNQQLESVKFGFLKNIRLNLEAQPKLKDFLDLLPQQLDFFTETRGENVPVETLMAELYEEVGAGKVKGDLLLDYRHYVRLDIEVKREGNDQFERVTSTNLSTGESIGTGIAVLIMVLMSWEEQTSLLRGNNASETMRFLMLDESSRLDQNALFTLTEICQNLELQLLIASPSVERTLRGTTHHLTRGHFNGAEQVIVRGRRLRN